MSPQPLLTMASHLQQKSLNNGDHHRRQQNMQQNLVVGTGDTDVEQKKLLEWELSSLGADDLRSHAWYHGHRVDRADAERLLRQCVADEHGFSAIGFSSNFIDGCLVDSQGEEYNEKDLDSDGLEDVSSVSSESDLAMDDFLDGLVDDRGVGSDPTTASSTVMATALLLQQRHRPDGVLSSVSTKRSQCYNRRYFYCFLVRDSQNVRPPGRYVVSCLRVDKYDDEENTNNKNNSARNAEHEQKRMQFLRRQRRRRQQRQQRHPVLHFVINEVSIICYFCIFTR